MSNGQNQKDRAHSDNRSLDRGAPASRVIAFAGSALALLAISLVAFTPLRAESSTTPLSTTEMRDTAPALASGEAACVADAAPANLNFMFKNLEGESVLLASFRDPKKVLLLAFGAAWCSPCTSEIPTLIALQEKYKDQLTIVGYSIDDTLARARQYSAEHKLNYPLVLGEGRRDLLESFGSNGFTPQSFIISKDGRMCRRHIGMVPQAMIEKELMTLMQ